MSLINKLSKEDKARHFPDGGKGSCLFRGRLGKELNNEKLENYKENFDKIDFSEVRNKKPSFKMKVNGKEVE